MLKLSSAVTRKLKATVSYYRRGQGLLVVLFVVERKQVTEVPRSTKH